MKLPLLHWRLPFLSLRRCLAQPLTWALFFVSPWVNAFRVDMLGQQVWFMGQAYPFAQNTLQWIPLVFYGGVLFIALTAVVLGRWFCGWACPHNTLTEWTRLLRQLVGREAPSPMLKRLKRFNPTVYKALQWASPVLAVGLAWVLGLSLMAFIVPPQWLLAQWANTGHTHIAVVFGQALLTLIGLFLLYCGHDFCRTCCPYGMGQSISAYIGKRWHPMEIRYTHSTLAECNTCTACQQSCPVDIDPRQPQNLHVGQFMGCFNCGACIDACTVVHRYQASWLGFVPPGLGRKN